MAGGNSHQRTVEKTRFARFEGRVLAVVSQILGGKAFSEKEVPWYETGSFWGGASIAIGIIFGVVAAMLKDVRWLLFVALPFAAICWSVICKPLKTSPWHWRRILLSGLILSTGFGLCGIYMALPKPVKETIATATTATEQDGFFDATSGKARVAFGGTFNLARDFSSFSKDGYADPFIFWGFAPIRLHLKNGALYCNIRMWQSSEHQGVEITDGKYRVWPSQWDWNQSNNEFEVVNESGKPVLQIIRKRANFFQVYGLIVLPGGVIIASQQSTEAIPWSEIKSLPSVDLKPIFRYPSQRFLGQYVEH
jgi:hypothetical protein